MTSDGSPEDAEVQFDEVFESPLGVMARKGRHIYFQSAGAESTDAFANELISRKDELKAELTQIVDGIRDVLSTVDGVNLCSQLWLACHPNFSREETSIAFAEYVTQLALTTERVECDELVDPTTVERTLWLAREAFRLTEMLYLATGLEQREERGDAVSDLRVKTLVESLYVRYPAYSGHFKSLLESLAELTGDVTASAIGWNLSDGVAMATGVASAVADRLSDRFDEARREYERLRKTVKRLRKGRRIADKAVAFALVETAKLKPSEADQALRAMLSSWIISGMQSVTVMTTDELVCFAGLERECLLAMLGDLSMHFGGVDESMYWSPSPTNPLTTRPVVRLTNDVWWIPNPNALLWAIRPALESVLNPDSPQFRATDGSAWDKYEGARSSYCEQTAVRLIAKALGHAPHWSSLRYSKESNVEVVDGELDGLVRVDDWLFLIEVKAGGLAPSARRGAPERMLEELDKLVGAAHGQASKALNHIRSTGKATFSLPTGGTLEIDSSKYPNAAIITVSLEALDAFTVNLSSLSAVGVLPEAATPWHVSLTDLMAITDVNENSSTFVHFLRRRLRAAEMRSIEAHDELDLFCFYLRDGLYFEHLLSEEGVPRFRVLPYTEELDDYFLRLEAGEKPRPPRQEMPERVRGIIRELERTRPEGYLRVACALLDYGAEGREMIAAMVDAVRRRAIEDGQAHDGSLLSDEGQSGLTYMCAGSMEELRSGLIGYCTMKKYKTKSDSWVGLGSVTGSTDVAQLGFVMWSPWEYDEELERLVEEAGIAGTEGMARPRLSRRGIAWEPRSGPD